MSTLSCSTSLRAELTALAYHLLPGASEGGGTGNDGPPAPTSALVIGPGGGRDGDGELDVIPERRTVCRSMPSAIA